MFAKFINNKCFFGLPGNPISTAACFRFFVMPFIFKSLHISPEKPILAKLKGNFQKKESLLDLLKVDYHFQKKGNVEFKILKGQESYKIKPFAKSNSWGVLKMVKLILKR